MQAPGLARAGLLRPPISYLNCGYSIARFAAHIQDIDLLATFSIGARRKMEQRRSIPGNTGVTAADAANYNIRGVGTFGLRYYAAASAARTRALEQADRAC